MKTHIIMRGYSLFYAVYLYQQRFFLHLFVIGRSGLIQDVGIDVLSAMFGLQMRKRYLAKKQHK